MQIKKQTLLTMLIGLGVLVSPGMVSHVHADVARPVQTFSRSEGAAKADSTSIKQINNSQANQLSNLKLKPHLKSKAKVQTGFNNQKRTSKWPSHLQARIKRSLAADNLGHYDNNRQQIGGMNRFAKRRARFYYPQISFNTRDLGGYLTTNGSYQVKPDRIIRSANLEKLSKSGLKMLKKLRIHQDVDLRFSNQIRKRPDPGEPKSNRLNKTQIDIQDDPVYSAQEDAAMGPGIHANGEWYFYGRSAVDNHDAIKAYRRIFRDLLTNQHGAILYHCDVGRDRTGVVSALILSALGVKRNTIFHDYLLTTYYRRKDKLHAVSYNQQASELKHFFDTINRQHGNINHYLQRVIGLKHSDIKRLRSMYLEPVDD